MYGFLALSNSDCSFFSWPSEDWKKVYYVFHLLITDLLVPLTIMSIAYGLMARTLWNGFKNISVVGKRKIKCVK